MRQMFFKLKANENKGDGELESHSIYSDFNTIRYSNSIGGKLYLYGNKLTIEMWDKKDFDKDLVDRLFEEIETSFIPTNREEDGGIRIMADKADVIVEIDLNKALDLEDPSVIFLRV